MKNIFHMIIGLCIVAALVLALQTFVPGAARAQEESSQIFITLLAALRSASFDLEFFAIPEFESLTDFSVELTPQPVGRRNPFAPLGSDPAESPEIEEPDFGDLLDLGA